MRDRYTEAVAFAPVERTNPQDPGHVDRAVLGRITEPNHRSPLYRCVHEVKEGDLILTPVTDTREILVEVCAGQYRYDPSRDPFDFEELVAALSAVHGLFRP